MNKYRKIISICAVIILFFSLFLSLSKSPVHEAGTTPLWQKFKSDKFQFSISYPEGWKIHESAPTEGFIIYKDSGDLDLNMGSFRDNLTLVAIYPRGYGWDGYGYENEINTEPFLPNTVQNDYLIYETNTLFLTEVKHEKELPKNWTPNNFIIGRIKLNEPEISCYTDECDYFKGAKFSVKGSYLDESDVKIIEEVIRSFKLIN